MANDYDGRNTITTTGSNSSSNSNARAIAIFSTYLLTNISLTVLVLHDIIGRIQANNFFRSRSKAQQSQSHSDLRSKSRSHSDSTTKSRSRSVLEKSTSSKTTLKPAYDENTDTKRSNHNKTRFVRHAVLVVICLAVTWYYMLSFFVLSYRSWEEEEYGVTTTYTARQQRPQRPDLSTTSTSPAWLADLLPLTNLDLGLWLKDVQLFRDAWEIVVETPARFFWSQPIFFLTAGWSFFVAREAHRLNIAHAWAYMVLGQLVAISFAMNLFFLAVLAYRSTSATQFTQAVKSTPKESSSHRVTGLWTPPTLVYLFITASTLVSVASTPRSAGSPYFLHVLALPHLLLLLPPVLCKVWPQNLRVPRTVRQYENAHQLHLVILGVAAVIAESFTVWKALHDDDPTKHTHRHSNVSLSSVLTPDNAVQSIFYSLVDHPAVSSVGWDSVLCLVNMFAWHYG